MVYNSKLSLMVYIKMYHTITSRDDTAHLQCYLDLLCGWCLAWQLQLSKDKCAVLHLGSQNPKFNYTLNNYQLPTTDQITYLGVVIDQKLDYTAHKAALCLKARSRCAVYLRTFVGRSENLMTNFF